MAVNDWLSWFIDALFSFLWRVLLKFSMDKTNINALFIILFMVISFIFTMLKCCSVGNVKRISLGPLTKYAAPIVHAIAS